MKDAMRKGRTERYDVRKLTNEQVTFIRRAKRVIAGKSLAEIFGVNKSTICKIQRNHRYKFPTPVGEAAQSLPV